MLTGGELEKNFGFAVQMRSHAGFVRMPEVRRTFRENAGKRNLAEYGKWRGFWGGAKGNGRGTRKWNLPEYVELRGFLGWVWWNENGGIHCAVCFFVELVCLRIVFDLVKARAAGG
jgi:hypothetical protein